MAAATTMSHQRCSGVLAGRRAATVRAAMIEAAKGTMNATNRRAPAATVRAPSKLHRSRHPNHPGHLPPVTLAAIRWLLSVAGSAGTIRVVDDQALASAAAAHAEAVHFAARRWTGNASVASEITALVFERARRERPPRRHVDRWLAGINADLLVARPVDATAGDGFDDVRSALSTLGERDRRRLARRLTGATKGRMAGRRLRSRLRPLMAPETDIGALFSEWATHSVGAAPRSSTTTSRTASALARIPSAGRNAGQRTRRSRRAALAARGGRAWRRLRGHGRQRRPEARERGSATTSPSANPTTVPSSPTSTGETPSTDVTSTTAVNSGGPAPAPTLTLQASCADAPRRWRGRGSRAWASPTTSCWAPSTRIRPTHDRAHDSALVGGTRTVDDTQLRADRTDRH